MVLIDSELLRKLDNLKDALTMGQLTRDEHLVALADAGVRQTLIFMLQAIEQLRPQRLQSDQDVYIRYLVDSIAFGQRYEQAVGQGNFVNAHLSSIDIFLARTRMLTDVSTVFCERTFADESKALCEDSEPPGGQYGAALRQFLRPLSIEFLPRIEVFPSQYAPEEVASASALLLKPGLIDTLTRAAGFVRELSPPARLSLDHDRITRYLAETLDTVLAIEQAIESQDGSLSDVNFGTLVRLRAEVADVLSDEARMIAAPYFHE